jgi:hypothetical protein
VSDFDRISAPSDVGVSQVQSLSIRSRIREGSEFDRFKEAPGGEVRFAMRNNSKRAAAKRGTASCLTSPPIFSAS